RSFAVSRIGSRPAAFSSPRFPTPRTQASSPALFEDAGTSRSRVSSRTTIGPTPAGSAGSGYSPRAGSTSTLPPPSKRSRREGDAVRGSSRAALASGFTAASLRERFEGSAVSVEVSPASRASLPASVRAVVDDARARKLPVDEEALQARSVRLEARRGDA